MSTAPRSSVSGNQRYRDGRECPICGGSENDDRGQGTRCHGFISGDGAYAHCAREGLAGNIPETINSQTFAHRLKGPCKCGVEHAPAEPRIAPTTRARSGKKPGPIVAEYDYVDERGELLFQAIKRFPPKSFSQRRPSGIAGTWIYDLAGVRRVLYRLPELLEADPSRPVFLVEGEKDVENLRDLGQVATCNPMGAGKWRDEYSVALKERVVFVIADNDPDEKGQNHAMDVVRRLAGIAREAKWVNLAEPCRDLGLGNLPEKGDVSDFLAMGGTVDDLLKIFDRVKPESESVTDCEGKPAERIPIEASTLRYQVFDEAMKALALDPDIYRRGPYLVRVKRQVEDAEKLTPKSIMRNLARSPKIIPMADQAIGTRLTMFADFYRMKEDKSGEWHPISTHPPDWLIKQIATEEYWPQIRRLMSVVECPFPRPDGSIVETPGYDQETCTLYMPSEDFPPVPRSPSKEDAIEAWERIHKYFRRFPFATDEDRVVPLAGLLNVLGRNAIEGPVMGVAVNGNKPATGKGLLVDAMVMPGIGRPAPTTGYPDSKEEAGKVKVAIVLSAKPVVSFDNLESGSTYGSSHMDSALTAYTIDERILGASKNTGDLEVRTTWFLNGNNISPAKDAYRRWMVCNLVTDLEDPENRGDLEGENLRKTILANRGEIVKDALIILKAHAQAGWPNGGWPPKGSFEEWDRVVRGAVWFATGIDCLSTQKTAADESPDRLLKIALLESWRGLPGGKSGTGGVTAAEAIKHVQETPGSYQALRSILSDKGKGGNMMTSGSLGAWLRGMKNTPFGGMKLVQPGMRNGSACWAVEMKIEAKSIGGETGDGGDTGDDSSPCTQNSESKLMYSARHESFKFNEGGPNSSPSSPSSPLNHETQSPKRVRGTI